MPTPPQQNAPWPHGADALSKAAATLFEKGLADPRGLEYREIEIAVGNLWDGGGFPLKTHGWILPNGGRDGQFAVAWNGLVYPVISIGHSANLHNDWEAISEGKDRDSMIGRRSVSEARAVHFGVLEPFKVVLLLRLGETELARRLWKLVVQDEKDPYLDLARDWMWNAFERAATAHMRGDDRLALADARMLAKIQPLIEAEAKQRGIEPDTDYSYPSDLKQLWALLYDCERRVANQKNPSPPKNDIAALIDDLENVDARQQGQPGGVSLAGDPRVKVLVKRGNEAVEPLLDAMENDTRLTRSVSFHRDFHRSRHLISVSEAAYSALVDFLRVDFRTSGVDGKPLSKKELATHIRATAGFRKKALRALTDKSLAGVITFHPREDWNSRGKAQAEIKGWVIGYHGSNDDPDMPPPGQKVSFRVSDVYAYFYSRYQDGPKFHLFWPEKKRDEGVLACRKWLEAKTSAERK